MSLYSFLLQNNEKIIILYETNEEIFHKLFWWEAEAEWEKWKKEKPKLKKKERKYVCIQNSNQ